MPALPAVRQVIKPQYAIERLYALTKGRDTYITTEVGQHQMWAAQFYHFEEPNRWMTSGGLGTMGYGLPAAVGVQIAHPACAGHRHRRRSLVQMTMQEMSTAVQYRPADQDLHPQQRMDGHGAPVAGAAAWRALFGHSYSEACPISSSWPKPMARMGIRCRDPADLDAAIMEMIETPKAGVFDCRVEKTENCLPMIPSGKAHNEMILPDMDEDMGDGHRRRRKNAGLGWRVPSPE